MYRELILILPIQVQDDRIFPENFLSSVRISIFLGPGYRIIGPHASASPAIWGLLPHRFLRKSSRYLGFVHVHSTLSAVFLLWRLCDWIKNHIFFSSLRWRCHSIFFWQKALLLSSPMTTLASFQMTWPFWDAPKIFFVLKSSHV